RLALAELRGGDRGDADELPVGPVGEPIEHRERDLRLVAAVELDLVGLEPGRRGDLGDRPELGFLRDLGGGRRRHRLSFLHSTTVLREMNVTELLAAIGERTPAPASGAATALTAALAAALAELSARYAGNEEDAERAHAAAALLLELGDADAEAYGAFMADRSEETRAEIVRIPKDIARLADA